MAVLFTITSTCAHDSDFVVFGGGSGELPGDICQRWLKSGEHFQAKINFPAKSRREVGKMETCKSGASRVF